MINTLNYMSYTCHISYHIIFYYTMLYYIIFPSRDLYGLFIYLCRWKGRLKQSCHVILDNINRISTKICNQAISVIKNLAMFLDKEQ